MIWLILGWLACGALSSLVLRWAWAWTYGRPYSPRLPLDAMSFGSGPVGLVASLWMPASPFAFSRYFLSAATNTANSAAALAESFDPEPVEEVTVPDAVIGWRWWSLDPLSMMLRGHVTAWTSGTMQATHLATTSSLGGHKAPHAGCVCGVNALKPEAVAGYLNKDYIRIGDSVDVFGRVALTGTVDEYQKGYRGEKAEILELVILSEAPLFTVAGEAPLSEMEGRYGVRPTVQSRKSWLAEMEVIHGYGKENQADSFRAGESTAGASQGTSQDGVNGCHLCASLPPGLRCRP
jgi:hypothetical protein